MPRRPPKTQADFRHTWYLREWMGQADPPLRQRDLINKLGWSRAKAHDVWHGQQYTQELIDELAPWLNVRPYELLLPPEQAVGLRRLRDTAAQIVADVPDVGFENVDIAALRRVSRK